MISKFLLEHKNFGKLFIFKKKDYSLSLKKGIGELKKLLEVYDLYIPTENPQLRISEPELSKYKGVFLKWKTLEKVEEEALTL